MPTTKLEGGAREIIADKNYAHLVVPRQDGTEGEARIQFALEPERVSLHG